MEGSLMLRLLLVALLFASPVAAQDRDGNDTPGEWVVDHYKAFGLWDSICDHRVTVDLREERCYLRYVEVFSRPPKFAAQFAFVTPEPRVEFGMEPGTRYAEQGFRILRAGDAVWAEPQAGCLVGLACIYDGEEAEALLDAMAGGETFAFDFTDRHGQNQARAWDLTAFAAARDDLARQAAARGLKGD